MTALTPAQRQARHRARQRQDGLVEVRVRVPADKVERLRKYVAKLNKEFERGE